MNAGTLLESYTGQKPVVELVGQDGNAFAIIGRVAQAWERMGRRDIAAEFRALAASGEYSHLLATAMAYVDEPPYDGLDEEEEEDEDALNDGGDPYRGDWDDDEEEDEDAHWIGQARSPEEADRRWNIVRMRNIREDDEEDDDE